MTYYTYNNPQTGDARWSKPAHPATNKPAFDCCGRTTPRNAASSSRNSAQSVHAEYLHNKSAGSPFAGASNAAPTAQTAVVKILAGGAVALLGLPMLILPGPGLLAIGAGVAIAASGIKDLQRLITQ